ncbi:MAG TPA: phosphoglucosamine mutase [Candidatus Acidoferrales bacterium]|jgi:phosphoglucosamine mutase|nr:phosphoglucosamine mutase [Candidatus Acidoferrales bacterium]
MPKELFGTDGIRGVAGEYPLDDQTLYWVGRSIGGYLRLQQERPRVLIGIDTRESGTHIASEIAAGLAEEGTITSFAGIITTPGVACLVRKEGFSAGVVISASHNPYHDNGVKLFAGSGMKFPDAIEAQIESEILRHRNGQPPAPGARLVPDRQLDEDYLGFLRGCMLPDADLYGFKIVLDCANGAASSLAPALFRSLGAKVIAIHDAPDGRNINANCGSLYPQDLQKNVPQLGASLGVAFDGDADRAMFVTASGRVVDGDGVLLSMARYLRSTGKLKGNAVVGTTMTNLGLERALAAEGLALARVPVGDRYVLEEMLRSGLNLGGEQSGHVIFLDDATTGDGLLTAIKIAGLVSLNGPLDELVNDLRTYPQTILNVKVRTKPPLESLPEVSRALDAATRALGDSGRVVLRYSGTEPKARVMVEAERAEDVEYWAEQLANAVKSAVGA